MAGHSFTKVMGAVPAVPFPLCDVMPDSDNLITVLQTAAPSNIIKKNYPPHLHKITEKNDKR